jgi:hypothetical protein
MTDSIFPQEELDRARELMRRTREHEGRFCGADPDAEIDRIADMMHDWLSTLPGWGYPMPDDLPLADAQRMAARIEAQMVWLVSVNRSIRDHGHALEHLRGKLRMCEAGDVLPRVRVFARAWDL